MPKPDGTDSSVTVNRQAAAPVSVIIPCYRCSATVERAVVSVMGQSRRPEEIILVDDASDDDTLDVLTGLQERFGRDALRLIRLPRNSGVASARNAGLDEARQPYVAFLDADDSWHPRKIELQSQWMREHPEAAITGHPLALGAGGGPGLNGPLTLRAHSITRRSILIRNLLLTSTVMLRRDLDRRFRAGKRYAEDYLLWLEIILDGHQGWFLRAPLAFRHKAVWGEAGLSSHLWSMELGILATYQEVRRRGSISAALYVSCWTLSLVKFARRLLVAPFRRTAPGQRSRAETVL